MRQSRDIATDSYARLLRYDTEAMREIITDIMCAWGSYDEWMEEFRADLDMLQRFKDNKHRIIVHEPLIVDYTDR